MFDETIFKFVFRSNLGRDTYVAMLEKINFLSLPPTVPLWVPLYCFVLQIHNITIS